jgi:hypothetical protein
MPTQLADVDTVTADLVRFDVESDLAAAPPS